MVIRIDGPSDGEFRWSIDVVDRIHPDELCLSVHEALSGCDSGPVRLWIHEVDPLTHRALCECGWESYRDLWQLRRALPAGSSRLETQAFTPGDIMEFVAVNNRAFSWHPEQGDLTEEQFRQSMSKPWFDADGLRLLRIEGQLAGFCWTKIHSDSEPPLGEIYVIAIDPDFHGRGLGAPMTLAGLQWLADQGQRTGMLYVESDNNAANAVYKKLGFSHHHTDRAYRMVNP